MAAHARVPALPRGRAFTMAKTKNYEHIITLITIHHWEVTKGRQRFVHDLGTNRLGSTEVLHFSNRGTCDELQHVAHNDLLLLPLRKMFTSLMIDNYYGNLEAG